MENRAWSYGARAALAWLIGVASCAEPPPADLGEVEQFTLIGGLGDVLGSSVATGTTVGRSNDFAPACISNSNAPDASYSWTAPWTGSFVFTTSGSAFDTVLDVRSGSNTSVSLGCNDDSNGTFQSTVTVSLAAGQAVRIVIDGFGGAKGTYRLGITSGTVIPPSGVDLWLRADLGVTNTGGVVSQWLDQSGRGRNATAFGPQPVLVPGALNGQPVVRFDEGDSLGLTPSTPTQFTIFVVGKNVGTVGNGDTLGFIFGGASFLIWLDPTRVWVGTPDGGHLIATVGNTNIYHTLALHYDGFSMWFYRDGLAQSGQSFSSTATWSFSGLGWINLEGDIAEVIIYDRAISGVEQSAVDTYLQTKYGLPRCGDGVCNGAETVWQCPQDCSTCGDGVCSGGETIWSCPGDCGSCGDGICGLDEDASNCPLDCGACPLPPCQSQ